MAPSKPPTHPGSARGAGAGAGAADSVRSAGQGSVSQRVADLARVSLARVSAAVADFAREVVEPPTQPVPVGAEAAEIAPLKTAEEGVKSGEEGQPLQLSTLTPDADEDGIRRRGSVFSGIMHVITAVIGAGVLTLPSAMAALGYVGGTLTVILAGIVTLYTAQLLADLYIINGKRQRTYTQSVLTCFGRKGEIAIGVIQLANLALTAIAYMVTAAKTMRTLAHAGCGLSPAEAAEAGNVTNCFDTYWIFVLLFGALQLVLSQVPSLENLAAASVIGAVASFGYAFIAFVMACAYAPRPPLGSLWGQPVSVWKDLNAVGNILFAFSFSFMLIEIQDTMKGDKERGPVRPMKKAVNIALAIMGAFYLAVALSGELVFFSLSLFFSSSALSFSLTQTLTPKKLSFLLSFSPKPGYAAFGDTAKNPLGILMPDDILTGFPGPRWAIFIANILVLVHMIPAFQGKGFFFSSCLFSRLFLSCFSFLLLLLPHEQLAHHSHRI